MTTMSVIGSPSSQWACSGHARTTLREALRIT